MLVPDLFSRDELEPVIESVNNSVDRLVEKLYKAGKIPNKAEGGGFYNRMSMVEKMFPGAAVLLHKGGYLPKGFQDLWAHEKLLNIVEQFIGPEIAANPGWNLRPKTPVNEETTVPWHQDNAYFYEASVNTLLATAWIPLIDANTTNGCMQVVKGGHRLGKTATHTCCAGNTWYVDLSEEEMVKSLGVDMQKDVVTCEVPMGGVLFLTNCIPHRSLENYSDKIRWSLDLRWQDPSKASGFEGMKDPMLLRSGKDPSYSPDWDLFASQDRNLLQKEVLGIENDEFDTTIHGQWMERWEITHHNRHTEALRKTKSATQ